MVLSIGDLIAVLIALSTSTTVSAIAFRRVYVLERRLARYNGSK